jgi:hypothetical protein
MHTFKLYGGYDTVSFFNGLIQRSRMRDHTQNAAARGDNSAIRQS